MIYKHRSADERIIYKQRSADYRMAYKQRSADERMIRKQRSAFVGKSFTLPNKAPESHNR